jgi:hypothetical protein
MNFQNALDELELDIHSLPDYKTLKKQFHKLALKYHPDKNSQNSNLKFQKINEAYQFLSQCMQNEEEQTSLSFQDLLQVFLTSVLNNNLSFVSIIKLLLTSTSDFSYDTLNKQECVDLFFLLHKYKDIFHVSDKILEFVSTIVAQKFKNDEVFILQPKLEDLLNHNVYKLYDNSNNLFLVPLWHNELYFDSPCKDHDIIVLCQPSLPPNIEIDDQNNLYAELRISLNSQLMNSLNYSFQIANKEFSIPLPKLRLKHEQFYRIKGVGIANISESNIYDITNKSDVILKIILC